MDNNNFNSESDNSSNYSSEENQPSPQQQSFPQQPQPQPKQPASSSQPAEKPFQPTEKEQPVNLPPFSENDKESHSSWNWLGWLTLVVLIAAALYFSGAWDRLGSLLTPVKPMEEASETVNNQQTGEEIDNAQNENQNDNAANKPITETPAEEGNIDVSILISSYLPGGATLTTDASDPNIEIRKVYFHNPVRKDQPWLLVYEGFRPLDLNLLNATGEKHELIASKFKVFPYDKVKLEFADLVRIDSRSDRKVARPRSVELDLPAAAAKEQKKTIHIIFNISKPDNPQPLVKVN